MGTRALLAFIFVLSAVSGGLQAYSTQGVSSLLSQYGVPSSVTSGLTTVNLTYAGGTYAALYQGEALYFLVNVTNANGYSFVTNATMIYNVIQPYSANAALQQANFTLLSKQMHAYQSSSASEINDCLLETGLSAGETCTLANTCYSCQIVPVCRKVLTATGGANATFGLGIMQFENQTAQLTSSFSAFYSAVSGVNSGNAQAKMAQLGSSFSSISSITQSMYENPIFPPTANITADVVQNCVYYITSASAPWYCNAVGFCENLEYNYTLLNSLQVMVNRINALPITNAQITLAAANVSMTENLYVGQAMAAQQQARVAKLLNGTLPGYGTVVNNTSSLLLRVSNASLSYDLSSLEASVANVTANIATANLTLANRTLSAQYAALKALYAKVNATNALPTGLARNNTRKLIELQASGVVSPALANLAFQEIAFNNQLFSGGAVSNPAALSSGIKAVAQKLAGYSTGSLSLVELARSIDAPFIAAVASSAGLGYADTVSLAPALGALLSLMMGAVVFALVIVLKSRMHRRHKVVLNHRTRRNWNIVLGCLLALILVYVLATYLLLASASASAPFAAFSSALGSSKQLVIAINGTPTPGEQACASAIKASLAASGGRASVASFSNGLCVTGNATESVDSCLGSFASTGVPVMVLTENATQGLRLYSLYGTRLTVSGPESLMDSCYAQYIVG